MITTSFSKEGDTERGRSAERAELDSELLRRPRRAWMIGEWSGSTDSADTITSSSSTLSSLNLSTPTPSLSSQGASPSSALRVCTILPSESDHLSASPLSASPLEISSEASFSLLPPFVDDGSNGKVRKQKSAGFGMIKGWFGGGSAKAGKKNRAVVVESLLTPPSSNLATPISTPLLSPTNGSHSHERSSPTRDGGDQDTDEDEEDIARVRQAEEEEAPSARVERGKELEAERKGFLSPIQTGLSGFSSAFGGRRSPAPSPGGSPVLSVSLDSALPKIDGPSLLISSTPSASSFNPRLNAAASLSSALPSGLTPLQSLHLLSSQKLSLLVRPPPSGHPVFIAPSSATAMSRLSSPYTSTDMGLPGSSEKKERRFPKSTNLIRTDGSIGDVSGSSPLRAEVGVRGLMRRLEVGGKARREEVEGLMDLFRRRPVSLSKNLNGHGSTASVASRSIEAILPPLLQPNSSMPSSCAPGSGVIAFLARPSFPDRSSVWLPTRLKSFDGGLVVVKGKVEVFQSSEKLSFSTGMEALGQEIRTGDIGSWRKSPRSSLADPNVSLAPIAGADGVDLGRRSPTDRVLNREVDEPVGVESGPKLPIVVVLPSSLDSRSSATPVSRPTPSPLRPSLKAAPSSSISTRTLSAPTLPTPQFLSARSNRISPLSRQSYTSPPAIDATSDSALDEEDEGDEDEVPLSQLRGKRTSFLSPVSTNKRSVSPISSLAGSASCASSTVHARSIPPTSTATSPGAITTPSLQSSAPLVDPNAAFPLMPRSVSRDRVLRFAPDTVDRSARRTEEEEDREQERLRLEEEEIEREGKRQERLKEEVRKARERREKAKLGQRKGNGGQWEDPAVVARFPMPSLATQRSGSLRMPSEEVSRPSLSRMISTGGEGRRVDKWAGPGPTSGMPVAHDRPPSLVSNTAASSPQTESPRSSTSSLYNIGARRGNVISAGQADRLLDDRSTSKHPSRFASHSSQVHSRASVYLPTIPPSSQYHQTTSSSSAMTSPPNYGPSPVHNTPGHRISSAHTHSRSQSQTFPTSFVPQQQHTIFVPVVVASYPAPPPFPTSSSMTSFHNPYFPTPQPPFAQPTSYSQPPSPTRNNFSSYQPLPPRQSLSSGHRQRASASFTPSTATSAATRASSSHAQEHHPQHQASSSGHGRYATSGSSRSGPPLHQSSAQQSMHLPIDLGSAVRRQSNFI